ncbi:hypothetical protein TrST_g11078 [Triparma strigata]|uniref:Ubiquitin-like domain-containing protein n=2 Tax=Triparma strigata TaxID=1606541 RepID=A0A9W7AHP5_9STRA|nr:hypothetical protein TrST_g11078 [Triparma strigata]
MHAREASDGRNNAEEIRTLLMSSQTPSQTFYLNADTKWTVEKLMEYGEHVHGIKPELQRLIFMGKQLTNEPSKTLKDFNILGPKEKVIHLFPKPPSTLAPAPSTSTSPPAPPPPHLTPQPPRLLVADEAAALTLHRQLNPSSPTFHSALENQRRVKMLSALLILICMMQLLTLFTIVAGIQSEPNREVTNDEGSDCVDDPANCGMKEQPAYVIRTWKNADYVDLSMSITGIWVGLTGLKATQNELYSTARTYFLSLLFVGWTWVGFSYYDTFTRAKEQEQSKEANAAETNDDYSSGDDPDIFFSALFASFLTLTVWSVCFYRAYMYQRDLWLRDRLEVENERRRVEEILRREDEQTRREEERVRREMREEVEGTAVEMMSIRGEERV